MNTKSNRHQKSIDYAVKILKSKPYREYIEAIYLFGSCSRGSQKYSSDVDLLVQHTSNFTFEDARKLRIAVMPEELELPEVDFKFVKGNMRKKYEDQFSKNLVKEGMLLWKKIKVIINTGNVEKGERKEMISMVAVKIPVGRSGFADIRKNGYYFVDKSGLIEELLKTDATQVTLITRPRRFGKTLAMSMLSEFFDIRKDSRALFAHLLIAENQELCQEWMNQYPVLFLTFKDVEGSTFDSAFGMLRSVIAKLYNEHIYLKTSEAVNEDDRNVFAQIADTVNGRVSEEQWKNSIERLTRMMYAHYGKPVILLLDEYDVPIAKSSRGIGRKEDYYEQMLEIIKPLISTAIKDNDFLKFAVITGCLRIAKESIFTGTNNFVSDTISDTRLNEFFGFTQSEVELLLKEADLTMHLDEMKEWYDGYHFGDFDVYCPWDVMNHVNHLVICPKTEPKSYWENTSDNSVVRAFIDCTGSAVTKKFETLLAGGYIIQKIKDDLTYDNLYSSEENLWSILYLTGYLTKMRDNELKDVILPKGMLALVIPNAEIQEIFEDTIKQWFEDSSKVWNRQKLFDSIWSGDTQTATSEMTKLLRRTISYHDYKEDFYHAFLAGIFAGADYTVESNKEHGEGRSDIVVEDYARDRVAVFEVKYSNSIKELEADCEKALAQIESRAYALDFEDDYAQVICYGIAFYKKRCLISSQLPLLTLE